MARVSLRELREDVKRLRRRTGVNYRLDIAYGGPRLVMESPPEYEPYSDVQNLSPRLSTGQLQQWIYAYEDGLKHAQELSRLRANYPTEDVEKPWITNDDYCENPDSISIKEAQKIATDCYDYFIRGISGKGQGGLNDLFDQVWEREPGKDYYPKISELCLNWETWLGSPEEWTEDELLDFAEQFQGIVSDSPNY